MMPPILRPAHEAAWERAQELLDARRSPSDDEALVAGALEDCPAELEAMLVLEAALEGLAERRPAAPAAPSPALRLVRLLRPAVAAGLLVAATLWSVDPDSPTPPTEVALQLEVQPADSPYGLAPLAALRAPSIESFSLTVTKSRVAPAPARSTPTRRPAIRELVATRTTSTPNRP